jgi:dipeptidyl aminopeptidase/acylaminoacyl peptidase
MVMSFRGTLDNPGNFDKSRSGLDDVLAALEYLKAQPETDAGNIFIAGHSSAASLALRAAQVSNIPRAVAAFSPATDWCALFEKQLKDVSDETRKFLEDSSPLTHAAQTKCPVLLTHGTADKVIPQAQSESFAAKLREAGKQLDYVSISYGDHYYSMLKTGIPLSLFWFSEIQKHGKSTELFGQFRDNLLKELSESAEPREK